jgi:hypothetical protein
VPSDTEETFAALLKELDLGIPQQGDAWMNRPHLTGTEQRNGSTYR